MPEALPSAVLNASPIFDHTDLLSKLAVSRIWPTSTSLLARYASAAPSESSQADTAAWVCKRTILLSLWSLGEGTSRGLKKGSAGDLTSEPLPHPATRMNAARLISVTVAVIGEEKSLVLD